MEELKNLFGEETLSYEQFAEKLNTADDLKLVNMKSKDNGYVAKEKLDKVLHSYNAKPKTLEELRDVVLAIQKEIEIARHEEKERQKGWKQQELIRLQQEAKQRKDSFKALKKEIGKYVIRYKSGERWKILFRNGEPLQFNTASEAKAHIEKLKLSYPGIEFKQRKWLFKQNGVIE